MEELLHCRPYPKEVAMTSIRVESKSSPIPIIEALLAAYSETQF